MPTGTDYNPAVVIINRHEPEGEVATRLLEIADEKGYDARTVEAQRGEHDAGISFRVPQDVADEFNSDRADRWPDKIENVDEDAADQHVAAVDGDAYGAEGRRSAQAAAVTNAANDQNSTPERKARSGKAKE